MPVLSELRDIVRRDPLLESTTVITDANLNTLLKEGALDLAKRGLALPLSATWSAVASTQRYVLSGGASPKVTRFLEVFQEGGGLIYTDADSAVRTFPNDFVWTSERKLDLDFPGWQDEAASDTLKAVALGYDSSGYLNLLVYPKSSTTTPSFKLNYLGGGTDMDGDTKRPWVNDTNGLPHLESYEKFIADYASWRLHKTKTFQEKLAASYRDLYLVGAAEMADAQRRIFKMEIMGTRGEAQVAASDSFGGL